MSTVEIVVIFIAGVAAGTINTVVGSGTLVTFPTLIAFGFPPVTATMSNAVGLVAGGVSGTWGYRRELRGQHRHAALAAAGVPGRRRDRGLAAAAPAGVHLQGRRPGAAGGRVVLVLVQPRLQVALRRRSEAAGRDHVVVGAGRMVALVIGTYVVGVYGGYFAAAQGILLVGVMGVFLTESMQRINAAKNLLTLVVNVVAATAYTIVAFDRISWAAAGLIAAGSLVGGFIGAGVGRRLSPVALRATIVVLGVIALWRLLAV